MPSHCSLAVIVVLIPFLLPVADSVAIVKVRFLYYSNPQGLLHNGHRCDPRIYLNKKYCDPFFTITVTVSGQKFEWKTGRAKEKNTVHFGSKIVDIENPLVTRVQSYYGQLDISVKVDDFDSVTSHDYMGSFSHRFVASARPFGDLSAPQEVKLVDSGKAAAELLLQISVQCETHYYGSDCSKFCQPGSNHHSGHYLCRSDGSKICEPTYSEHTECRDKFCSSQLCHNGGTCIDLPNKFVCECQRPFGGDTCTERIAPCQHNRPCQNGGTCHAGVGCACPTGFHGDACQNDVDECQAVSPCRGNGSVCENWFGTYSCRCGAGWSGRNCTEDVDECAMTDYPMCFNGGRCENTQGSFICHCSSGFNGKRCQEDIDECQLNNGPCWNGTQVCQNLWGSFICMCQDGLKGPNCTQPWAAQLESLSDFPWWSPVLVAIIAVSALAALLLVKRSSACTRIGLCAFTSKPPNTGKEKSAADNPVYCADFSTAAEAPYDETQEAADFRRPAEDRGPELPPPLPPRSLNVVTIHTQYQTMMPADATGNEAQSVQSYLQN